MQYAFGKLTEKCKTNGYMLMLSLAIIAIICAVVYRYFKGYSSNGGTWTKKKYYELLPVKEPTTKSTEPTITKQGGDSKGEIECRRVLREIFNKPFEKARPQFLNNPVTGGSFNLELDCFDDELKIAVEYNGRQHYEYTPFFHKNKDQFTMQKYRDDMKRRICKDQGILLIEVPHTIPIKNIESFIMDILRNQKRI
jgi:hypothetical protein